MTKIVLLIIAVVAAMADSWPAVVVALFVALVHVSHIAAGLFSQWMEEPFDFGDDDEVPGERRQAMH